jgi:O-succinylbenzoic acid--CoA ligase
MPEWLRQRARLTPQRLALITSDAQLTFAQLDAAVEDVALRLIALGVQRGDVVALLAGNGGDFVKLVHAVGRVGAVLLPLNVRLSANEVVWQLRDASPRLLIHDEADASLASAAMNGLNSIRIMRVETLIATRAKSHGGRVNDIAISTSDPPSPMSDRGLGGEVSPRFDLGSVQGIVYTSGTTGRPKGALLTFGNHFWSATGSALNLGLLPDDRWLACLPLFHVSGLSILFRSVIYAIPVIVHEAFDAERVNRAIDEDGVTIVSVVSAMLQRLLEARGDIPYPASLRCVLLGGGPAPESLLRDCEARGVPVVQTYGLTETASQVATLPPEDALRKLGSAGKPLFPNELQVVRNDDSRCNAGEPGQILVRGPSVTPGYLNRPDETARALQDGWLHTGDIGYVDAEGYLYVLDRRDDLIVSGGENVYPAEVEGVLQAHAAVLEAGVIGVADERWGQAPAAFVVLRHGVQVTDLDLVAFCSDRLARFKLPSRIVFTASLPRNAAGKLLRQELRHRWAAES